jgi:7-keto-8-aminopelargonate synthetase-like enzyme
MSQRSQVVELVNTAVEQAAARGLAQLPARDAWLDGRLIHIGGRATLNFASCSYLGLEMDPRLREGAIDAILRYGTQFSSSRAYLELPLYAELEALLDRIFDAHTLVAPNTTLAHLAALPVLVEPEDAAILDHQVHQTVQLAAGQLRLEGTAVEIVRHGDTGRLDERIRELAQRHPKVWYLADGVYSMYGDRAPLSAIAWLLERHERLHVYLDDAHGMSWSGLHGRGVAAETLGGHPRVVIAVSLNKAFGAGGGALVFPDPVRKSRVRNVGSTLMFTGPLQPPQLGAALASARIHLSPEIETLQAELAARIAFADSTARELDLPLASRGGVPIHYVGMGVQAAALALVGKLLERGIYMNPCAFPAVGSRNAGVRFTITRHQSESDIASALGAVAELLPGALADAGTSREEVDRAFGLSKAAQRPRGAPRVSDGPSLLCQHANSIRELDAAEWDRCMAGRGAFDAATLAALEPVFGPQEKPENRWSFHYYVVREPSGTPVLATFFSEALWKDDLLAAATVSRAVEERRSADPYFLTSRILAMGCLLTEGEHLWLDRSRDWRAALALLVTAVQAERDACEAAALVVRDVAAGDRELAAALGEAGFFRVELPESLEVAIAWHDRDEFLARLSRRERRFQREQVEPFADAWDVERIVAGGRTLRCTEWAHLNRLYDNVHRRQLALNTFALPQSLLPQLAATPGWELLLLRPRQPGGAGRGTPPQGFVLAHAGRDAYTPLLIGMDYAWVESHGLYRQLLAHAVRRAEALGVPRVRFGMGSALEKRRFGAAPFARAMFVQSHDRYHHDLLELIASSTHLEAEGSLPPTGR